MEYINPGCAYCPSTVRVCHHTPPGTDEEHKPEYCPTNVDQDAIDIGVSKYGDPEIRKVAHAAALATTEGHHKWTRVEMICGFAKKMGYKKIGIATCISFLEYARTLSSILESHGFEVASAACMVGSVAKEEIGVGEEDKIIPGRYETMCNTITQAELLNRAGSEFNVVLGLCVGHDSLFFRHSEALSTVLVSKDGALAHNALGALAWAHSYQEQVWGPDRPPKVPSRPAEGRRKRKS